MSQLSEVEWYGGSGPEGRHSVWNSRRQNKFTDSSIQQHSHLNCVRDLQAVPWLSGEWREGWGLRHNANRTQDRCRANLPHFWEKEVWPPSSPDVNPLDFFVWGVAERDTNRSPHNTKDSLIRSIKDVFTNFHREDVVHACSRVRSRVRRLLQPTAILFDKYIIYM